jgi:hypothetical protein
VKLPQRRFSGLLLRRSWPIKFEGQFKVRDERGVNAQPARLIAKSRKRLRHKHKSEIVKAGLPCDFAQR